MFYKLAGYPLARLDGHIKFTIPVSVGRVGEEEEVRRHWVGQGGGGSEKDLMLPPLAWLGVRSRAK